MYIRRAWVGDVGGCGFGYISFRREFSGVMFWGVRLLGFMIFIDLWLGVLSIGCVDGIIVFSLSRV